MADEAAARLQKAQQIVAQLRAAHADLGKRIDETERDLVALFGSDPLAQAAPEPAATAPAPAAEPAEPAPDAGFAAASAQVMATLAHGATRPDTVIEALQAAHAAMRTARDANELFSHLEAARQAGPEPPHPFFDSLSGLETQAMSDGIGLATRLDEAMDFADTFWKHYGQPTLTEKSYARAVDVAGNVAECLEVARKARLRFEEVGIKQPGEKKPSSFRRKAPFGPVAQRAVAKARTLIKAMADRQRIEQEVRAIEREFQQLNLESSTSLW